MKKISPILLSFCILNVHASPLGCIMYQLEKHGIPRAQQLDGKFHPIIGDKTFDGSQIYFQMGWVSAGMYGFRRTALNGHPMHADGPITPSWCGCTYVVDPLGSATPRSASGLCSTLG